ncbi:MAG: ABC transporter substrate-binding protein [Gammaproteobacteria bacterium]|nr:ABC transporter substrate-binding protein [Gammaproteobacteria bacterium]
MFASFIRKMLPGLLLFSMATSVMAEIVFYSTQARPLEEAQRMRDQVLSGFSGGVKFLPQATGTFFSRIDAEQQSGQVTLGVLGALHGQFPPIGDGLDSVDDVLDELADRKLDTTLVELGRLGSGQQVYVPWMQATYIMAAHKKALQYLPDGADINSLTYAELTTWGKNMKQATGQPRLGFPAGPKGLMHRFLQGYLYPSFTESVVTRFRSEDARTMWERFKTLWETVNPRSTAYNFMQEPLLNGEVWVAFDHTARLKNAFARKPDEFIAFPAPAGPKGRGFMPVVAGLAIPRGAPDRKSAVRLIDYLTRPETQIATLKAIGFYPVVDVELPDDLPADVRIAGQAVNRQSRATDAIPSLLPVGLGDQGAIFNKVYSDAFRQIVLRGADVEQILNRQSSALKRIIKKSGAPCWLPDKSSSGPCPVH